MPDDDSIIFPILYAALGGIGGFLVMLFVGVLIGAFDVPAQTAAVPAAVPYTQSTFQGVSQPGEQKQSGTPTQNHTEDIAQREEPGQEPETQETGTEEPPPESSAQSPEPVEQPPEQNKPPASSNVPADTAPTQAGGTISNRDGTYTHDFSGGRVLATAESSNGNDLVYHIKDCGAAKKIPPGNEIWYASEDAAKADGRRLCGNCGR